MSTKPIHQNRALALRKAAMNPNPPWGFVPIEKYEGLYAISAKGEVYSHISNKLLKLVPDSGYLVVSLGSKDRSFAHVLVAETFIVKPDPSFEVDHINRNRGDNRSDNLRWVPHSVNAQNIGKHGRCKNPPASKFKGVVRTGHVKNPWRASVVISGNHKLLGVFRTEEEAGRAYDSEAIKQWGKEAATNEKL